MYYERNVYFLNPHYREIRTMGGRTNRGPGVEYCANQGMVFPKKSCYCKDCAN